MNEFDEFRVTLTPDIQAQGAWNVLLDECPIANLVGQKGSIQPGVTREQLVRLRSRYGWPNSGELRTIGETVWQSLMTPELAAAFNACLARSNDSNSGRMRFVVSVVGEEAEPVDPGKVRLQEVPLEALYHPQGFLARNPYTPISRSLSFRPDCAAHPVALPLRILVVVATPQDKPTADMQAEKEAIQEALTGLTGPGGPVDLDFCEPPTRAELRSRLRQKRFHILHFIGHGAFDIVGNDPSPRPYLCLEKDDGKSDLLDAETLEVPLLNSDVRLVVMTVCSSASHTPEEEPYHARAFDGLAQQLVGGSSDVSAVVAMQFDLESEAAMTFSSTFYSNLLKPDRTLDETVALCRQDLAMQMDAGHRAWVTPVVYWRCIGGRVFDLQGTRVTHDEQTQQQLNMIDVALGAYYENIAKIGEMPPEMQDGLAPWLAELHQKVEELQVQRGQLLGDALRLRGGAVEAGGAIQCQLSLQLRSPARIGDVNIIVNYPADKVELGQVNTGASLPPNNYVYRGEEQEPGTLPLLLSNASQGAQWEPDEYELAVLTFQVREGVPDQVLELTLAEARVQIDDGDTQMETLDAVLFVA